MGLDAVVYKGGGASEEHVLSRRIGNIAAVSELRNEIQAIPGMQDGLLLRSVLYSGSHSGDRIELTDLPALSNEISSIRDSQLPKSAFLLEFLDIMEELIATARLEKSPINFV